MLAAANPKDDLLEQSVEEQCDIVYANAEAIHPEHLYQFIKSDEKRIIFDRLDHAMRNKILFLLFIYFETATQSDFHRKDTTITNLDKIFNSIKKSPLFQASEDKKITPTYLALRLLGSTYEHTNELEPATPEAISNLLSFGKYLSLTDLYHCLFSIPKTNEILRTHYSTLPLTHVLRPLSEFSPGTEHSPEIIYIELGTKTSSTYYKTNSMIKKRT